jgi:hypothetical protein
MGEVHPISVVLIVAAATLVAFLVSPYLAPVTGNQSFA